MTKTRTLVPLALAVAFATNASAACLSDAQAAELAAHYLSRQPAANPEGLSDADGACTRAKFNALLASSFGKVVGYKAGLTNPAVQKRFNTDKPVWGKLYEGMVLENGATVEAAFGARPLYEADMLVRVKSAAINQARTPMEVLEAIDQVIPFIELPDLVVQAPPKLNGAGVVYQGLQTLGQGAVLVGLILGTMVTFILEKKFLYAAIASAVGAVLSFIGLIHAPEVSWAASPQVAALADAPSTQRGVLSSRDTDLMVAALRGLGVRIEDAFSYPEES